MRAELHSKNWLCERYSCSANTLRKWLAEIYKRYPENFPNGNTQQKRFTPAQIEVITKHLGPYTNP